MTFSLIGGAWRASSSSRRTVVIAICVLIVQASLISDVQSKRTFSMAGRGGGKKMPNFSVRRKAPAPVPQQPAAAPKAPPPVHKAAAASPVKAPPAAGAPPPSYAQAMRDTPPSYGSLYPGGAAQASPSSYGSLYRQPQYGGYLFND